MTYPLHFSGESDDMALERDRSWESRLPPPYTSKADMQASEASYERARETADSSDVPSILARLKEQIRKGSSQSLWYKHQVFWPPQFQEWADVEEEALIDLGLDSEDLTIEYRDMGHQFRIEIQYSQLALEVLGLE